jgi:hypothetical protein
MSPATEAYVAQLVANAPPPTPEQLATIAAVLSPCLPPQQRAEPKCRPHVIRKAA